MMKPCQRIRSRRFWTVALVVLLGVATCGMATSCNETPHRAGHPPSDGATEGSAAVPDGAVLNCPDLDKKKSCQDGWCAIPAGCFTMGSPETESCRESDEPLHKVQLRRGFEISEGEVTQEAFQKLMGYSPSKFSACGPQCPVENVSWNEAAAYCNELSKAGGLSACYDCTGNGASLLCFVASAFAGGGKTLYDCPGYRLPTEAEWEHAARAGSESAYYNGNVASCLETDANANAIAWYRANSSDKTQKVGQKLPNGWGLHDLSGNVWEWTADWYGDLSPASALDPLGAAAGISKTVRGGSYSSTPNKLRLANRTQQAVEYRSSEIGFRCARSRP